MLFLQRLAIVARLETARVEHKQNDIWHEADTLRRDFNRAVDNGNAAEAERLGTAAAEYDEALRPLRARLAGAKLVLELCYARPQRYGAGLGPNLQFSLMLETAMADEAAKAERQMRLTINAAN